MKFLVMALMVCAFHVLASHERFAITAKSLDETVTVQVALPDTYNHSHNFSYPLLIVLDGTTQFDHLVSSNKFLSNYAITPEMIVVGVNVRDRLKYYTHTEHKDFKGRTGQAKAFEQFITTELVSLLAEKYRVAPYTLVFGHSLSGLFSSYLLFNSTNKINAAISISPSLWYDDMELVRNYQQYPIYNSDSAKRWYLSLASEPGKMKIAYQAMLAKLEQNKGKSLVWSTSYFPDETHDSTPLIGSITGLKHIFQGWNAVPEIDVMSLKQLNDFYQQKAKAFGYQFPLSVHQYNVYGLKASYEGQTQWGVEILQQGVAYFQFSEILWDSLATAYSLHGDITNALKASQQAMKLAKKANSIYLNDIIAQHTQLKRKAEDGNNR